MFYKNKRLERPAQFNAKIISAFGDFYSYVDSHHFSSSDAFCKGGFINTEDPALGSISLRIIQNRIVDPVTEEKAYTQDDAGITCMALGNKWFLFSALNPDTMNQGKDYYCIDSNGRRGNTSFDADYVKCN